QFLACGRRLTSGPECENVNPDSHRNEFSAGRSDAKIRYCKGHLSSTCDLVRLLFYDLVGKWNYAVQHLLLHQIQADVKQEWQRYALEVETCFMLLVWVLR